MNALSDLVALQAVVEAGYTAAESRMAALRAQEQAILTQLHQLQEAERDRAHIRDITDAALRAGADLRWEQWIAQRRQQLNAAWARLRGQIETERGALAVAFGRKTVLAETLAAERRAIRMAAERRSRRDG